MLLVTAELLRLESGQTVAKNTAPIQLLSDNRQLGEHMSDLTALDPPSRSVALSLSLSVFHT